MPNCTDSPTLLLCNGKHCVTKQRAAYRALEDVIHDADIRFVTVGCLGSCSGPTAMVCHDGDARSFEDLRSNKVRADLVEYLIRPGSKPSKRLRERELTGKKAKRAAKKLAAR